MQDFLSSIKTFTITADEKVLWLIFYVILLVTATISIILVYHWRSYAYKDDRTLSFARVVYFIGVAILLSLLLIALLSYTQSL